MPQKMLTLEDKINIIKALAPYAKNVKEWPSMEDASNQAGIDAIGDTISYYIIRKWGKEIPECGEILSQVLLSRAETYSKIAANIVENIPEFFTDDKGSLKERMQAVNKAKFMVEHYVFHMSKLAPDIYGDYYYELKRMQDDVNAIKKQLQTIGK